jgi:hypothetical protein
MNQGTYFFRLYREETTISGREVTVEAPPLRAACATARPHSRRTGFQKEPRRGGLTGEREC